MAEVDHYRVRHIETSEATRGFQVTRFVKVEAACEYCGRRAATRSESRRGSVNDWARQHGTSYHEFLRWKVARQIAS